VIIVCSSFCFDINEKVSIILKKSLQPKIVHFLENLFLKKEKKKIQRKKKKKRRVNPSSPPQKKEIILRKNISNERFP